MERLENQSDSLRLGSRTRCVRFRFLIIFRLKLLFETDWRGLRVVRNKADWFELDIGLRRNESLFTLASDSFDFMSDWIGFIRFDPALIWIEFWYPFSVQIQLDLFGLMSCSFGLKFEKTYGFKRIRKSFRMRLRFIRIEMLVSLRIRILLLKSTSVGLTFLFQLVIKSDRNPCFEIGLGWIQSGRNVGLTQKENQTLKNKIKQKIQVLKLKSKIK